MNLFNVDKYKIIIFSKRKQIKESFRPLSQLYKNLVNMNYPAVMGNISGYRDKRDCEGPRTLGALNILITLSLVAA